MRNAFLIFWIGSSSSRLSKVGHVDAARKRINGGMPAALGFIKTLAAGENEIDALQKLPFKFRQKRMRAFERRQLIHAVIHGNYRAEVLRERESHGRVVPEDIFTDAVLFEEPVKHLFHDCVGSYFAA